MGGLLIACALLTGVADAEVREIDIDAMTATANWQVGGHRINYVLGNSTLVATDEVTRDGEPCLKLTYDFRDANRSYISAYHTGPAIPGDCQEIGVWVYGDESGRPVRFAIEDQIGTWFERDVATIDWQGWREVRATVGDGSDWRQFRRNGDQRREVEHPIALRQVAVARHPGADPEASVYLSAATATTDARPMDYVTGKIWTERPGSLFDLGEDVTVHVELTNTGQEPVEAEFMVSAADFGNIATILGSESVKLAPGETQQRELSAELTRLGTYSVKARLMVGERHRLWFERLAITKPREQQPADADARYGSMCNVETLAPDQMDTGWKLNRDAGLRWTRMGFGWGVINPAPGVWIWDGFTSVDGPVGKAADPEGRALRLAHDDRLNCEDAVTIGFWARGAEENGGWQTAVQKWGAGNERNYGVYFHKDTGEMCFSASYENLPDAAWKDVSSGVSAWNDEWHHYAASYSREAQQVKLYVDGELTASEAVDGGRLRTNGAELVIAQGCPATLDELVLYGRALDDGEVASLAAKLAPPQDGLITHWAFEDDGGTVVDSSGNGFDIDAGEPSMAIRARQALEHGMKTLGLLGFPPDWASTAPEGADRPHVHKPDLDAWASFVENVTRHYADTVQHWELWNEPNITVFWEPDPDPKEFIDVVRVGYEAAKRGNPDCTVIMPGLAGPGDGGWGMDFIEELIELGGATYCDGVAIHPYRQSTPEASDLVGDLKHIAKLCADNGNAEAGKHIWYTENCWTTQLPGGSTEKRAAMMLPRCYALSLASGLVDKMLWFRLHDPGVDRFYGEHNYGMCWNDLTPKPAYFAHRTFAEIMEGAEYEGEWDVGPRAIAHVFRTAKERVAAVWCPDGDELTSIYVAKRRATVTDIMGNDESMPAGGDVLWLPTGESVRYVRDLSDDAEGRGTLQAFDPCQVARGETGTLTMRMRNPFDSEWQASPTLLATENQPLRITKDGVVKADEVTELHFGPLETVTVDGPVEVDPDAIPGIYAVTGAGLTSPVEIAVRGAAPDAGPVGVWKLDEGEGTVITDSSGTGNDGTVAEPKWVEGVSGTALEFDGTQTAEIPTSASLNLQDEMTLAFWIRLGPETGDWQFPVGKYSHDPLVRNYGMYIHKDTLDPCFSASFEDGGYAHTDVRSNMPINDGEWHHVVATCSVFDARTRIYVDGEPVVDQVMAEGLMLVADAPLRIGASTVGAIDEVMVWPRVLNGEEVSELALGGD